MTNKPEIVVFVCNPRRDHECDDLGPFFYGGNDVETVTDIELAGKGYSWGSSSCSKCGDLSMNRDAWS